MIMFQLFFNIITGIYFANMYFAYEFFYIHLFTIALILIFSAYIMFIFQFILTVHGLVKFNKTSI